MTAQGYVASVVIPAATQLLPPLMDSRPGWAMLLAIGRQESGFKYRRQVAGRADGHTTYGPARGWWQFELGGVEGVLEHPASRQAAAGVLDAIGYQDAGARDVHLALEHNDVLACAFARLLLWTDPRALPLGDNPTQGWLIYLSTWRPGRPHAHTWAHHYENAWATEWPGQKVI
jgi:hypothetical protein